MMKWKKGLALLMAAVLVIAMAACAKQADEEEPAEVEEENSSRLVNPLEDFAARDGEPAGSIAMDVFDDIAEKKAENDDTVGWLRVPGTNIDDVVVFSDQDNWYYERRGFDKNFHFNGVFYADFRCSFGDGSLSQLGVNTCIYGHAMTDDTGRSNYNIKFGQLHDFRDEAFARKTPYLLFSSEKESLVFEIFAVFVTNSTNRGLPYNQGDLTLEQMKTMIEKEVLPRSLYNYDVDLEDAEKFLTLSTCIYVLPDGTTISNPDDTSYRYAIMARLVGEDEPLKEEAAFTVNETYLLDSPESMADKTTPVA